MSTQLNHEHRFEPGDDGAITLLLLHGTGGDENDLLPLGRALAPDANLLSPRGNVIENGMPRFFRRLAMGVFDVEDLERRTHELAEFLSNAAKLYGLDPTSVVPVGFSNGANIGASLLLRHPGLVRGALLLKAMIPFEPDDPPHLAGTSVFVSAGRSDEMISPDLAERLMDLLEEAGAEVTRHWEPGGHGLTSTEVAAAKRWLDRFLSSPPTAA